jgi:hypothetical protein
MLKTVFRIDGREIGLFSFEAGTGPRDSEGRIDLKNADLEGVDMHNACLARANLMGANLRGANLESAELGEANLEGADLRGACLYSAYCYRTNFHKANFEGANLQNAGLEKANLSMANLVKANLDGVVMDGAYIDGAILPTFQIPQDAELIVWKKLRMDLICKLRIPAETKRTASLVGNKCRAEFAEVLEIEDCAGGKVETGISLHDPVFVYKVGGTVRPTNYEDDIREACLPGIHFFLTRAEAEDY